MDIRQWVSYENNLVEQAATPTTVFDENVEIKIIDLFQGATPNS